ncbi:MAG: helix-turn-helix domain-containing protein [Anaerolineae bacterium]|nr:helix-turn-helix domain-containing protein [Anaerolineae bacterium]
MQTPHYEQVRPPPALSNIIECFWRLLLPLVVAPDEIISAEGRAEILFQFDGQSQILPHDADLPFDCASSWLMRPFAHALHVRQIGVTSSAMIGVRFTPGGWATFHHTDTTDNQSYSFMPLSDFYNPSDVRLLEEQLYSALVTPQWAYPLITFFVNRKIEQTHFDRITYAAKQLAQQQVSVPVLAHEVNLSDRQFGRVFRQIIGLSPKQFSRIARLNRVLKSPDYNIYGMTLEQLALKHGYHDPSHLIREFQELVGMSPVEYFSGDHDLIEQKFREDDRFLQWEPDTMSMLSTK